MREETSRKSAIVTGAGMGIGRAVAVRLAVEGWRVALAARTESALEETKRLMEKAGGEGAADLGLVAPTDLARAGDVERLVELALERFGRIDALVNNAGVAPLRAPIEETTADLLERVYRVNVFAPALTIAALWPVFRRQGGGCIVNVSSMASIDPFPGFFVYASSKAAMNLQVQTCAKEGAEFGVRAFSVAPGAVETPMLRSLFDEKTIPPEACLQPDDLAQVIVDCILGRRDEDNGRVIPVARESG